jgi:hypothetical protein
MKYVRVVVRKPVLHPQRISRGGLESLPLISREEGSATQTSSEVAMARLGIAPRQRLELATAFRPSADTPWPIN